MKKFSLLAVAFIASVLIMSCGGESTTSTGIVKRSVGLPAEKEFVAEGASKEFADAKITVYAEVMKAAIIDLIGESAYSANSSTIENNFLAYRSSIKYINEKSKKWLESGRDASGNIRLKLRAPVKMRVLSAALSEKGISGTKAVATTTTTSTTTTTVKPATTTTKPAEDLSGVDITGYSFLAYFDEKKCTGEKKDYALQAVSRLNKGLAAEGITVFDVDTVLKLAKERTLQHEDDAGSVSLGMILAEKAKADLYLEVFPTVNYSGNKAHVMLNVKVFDRTSGVSIASLDRGGLEYNVGGLDMNIKYSMRDAVKNIMKKLIPQLKKYAVGGKYYFVRLENVASAGDIFRFTSAIKKISGVVQAKPKSAGSESGVGDVIVRYKGDLSDLMEQLMEVMPSKPGFEGFKLIRFRGTELIFKM